MLDLVMEIEQTDNGWVLRYTGHDVLPKERVYHKWGDVLKELNAYFGWYDLAGKQFKANPYL